MFYETEEESLLARKIERDPESILVCKKDKQVIGCIFITDK